MVYLSGCLNTGLILFPLDAYPTYKSNNNQLKLSNISISNNRIILFYIILLFLYLNIFYKQYLINIPVKTSYYT